MPVVPATQKAEAGGSSVSRKSRLHHLLKNKLQHCLSSVHHGCQATAQPAALRKALLVSEGPPAALLQHFSLTFESKVKTGGPLHQCHPLLLGNTTGRRKRTCGAGHDLMLRIHKFLLNERQGDSRQRRHTDRQHDSFGQHGASRCGVYGTDGLVWSHPHKENSNWKR
ncbi:hypothetical protein AAY473_031550 [Plecturocebus cupreus]